MCYRPNDPVIMGRSPQHGIHIVGSSNTSKLSTASSSSSSSSSSASSWSSLPKINTVTANCAKPGCANTVTVVPHGYHHDRIHIHVECKECYVPVFIKVEEKKENKVPVVWDDEEWGGVPLAEEHVEGEW